MNKSLALLLTSLLAFSGVAHANLIQNGSFEQGNQTPVKCNDSGCAWVELKAADTPQKMTGWRVDTGTVNWHNNVNPQFAQNGGWMIDLNDVTNAQPLAELSQDFVTSAGQSYELFFWMAGPNKAFPDPRAVRVDVGSIMNEVLTTPASNNPIQWEQKMVSFQATGDLTTLSFSSVNKLGFWGAFLDNVCVQTKGDTICPTTASVPEPATLGLLGLGLLGLGMARRRRIARA
jgi:choice-of-anchor C domain-containing protein